MARAIIPAHGPADGDALVAVGRPIDADAGLSDDVGTARLLAATAVQHAIAASRT
jgi:hypothetical protein